MNSGDSSEAPKRLRRAGDRLAGGLAALFDAVTPPACPITGERVSKPGLLSPAGFARLQFIAPPACLRCGAPFAADHGADVACGACLADAPDYDQARAAVVYDDASHRLVVAFKHSDRTDLAPLFAHWIARAGADLLTSDAVLVPTPLHRARLFARRYNQSALIAQALARITGLPVDLDALRRVRPTPPQQSLSADARRRNVAGAFAASPEAQDRVRGRRYILVDDVLTTGATLSACARALKAAGAAGVDAVVVARVVRGGLAAL